MTLNASINNLGNWIKKNQLIIIIGLIVFVVLVKQGIIPSTFSISTLSIFGGTLTSLSIGIFLILGGVGLLFIPGIQIFSPIMFLGGGLLITGGAAISSILQFMKTLPGAVLAGIILLILLKKFKII